MFCSDSTSAMPASHHSIEQANATKAVHTKSKEILRQELPACLLSPSAATRPNRAWLVNSPRRQRTKNRAISRLKVESSPGRRRIDLATREDHLTYRGSEGVKTFQCLRAWIPEISLHLTYHYPTRLSISMQRFSQRVIVSLLFKTRFSPNC